MYCEATPELHNLLGKDADSNPVRNEAFNVMHHEE